MSGISNFRDLKVWQLAHQTVLRIYEVINGFPENEKFSLSRQLTRAVVSIPANIAEGTGRFSTKEYIHFLTISRGSVEECKYLIILSKDLGFIQHSIYEELEDAFNNIGRMLNGLIKAIKTKENKLTSNP